MLGLNAVQQHANVRSGQRAERTPQGEQQGVGQWDPCSELLLRCLSLWGGMPPRVPHNHRRAHAHLARRSWAASVLLLCAVAISLPTFAQAYEKGSIEFFDFYG